MIAMSTVRLATEEAGAVARGLYDRNGTIDTVLLAVGTDRQLSAIVDDPMVVPRLGRRMVMAVGARVLVFVGEAFGKEYLMGDPIPDTGDLIEQAERDPSIYTLLSVAAIDPADGDMAGQRSTPHLSAHGQHHWEVLDILDFGQVGWLLNAAVESPLIGGPLAHDDLPDFCDYLVASGLTPHAEVMGASDG